MTTPARNAQTAALEALIEAHAVELKLPTTTIMRIRRVGREGALTALASSKPGGGARGGVDAELLAARAEIARLEETVKEQAIELVALRGKTRSGW